MMDSLASLWAILPKSYPCPCPLLQKRNTGLSEVDPGISKCSFLVYWYPALCPEMASGIVEGSSSQGSGADVVGDGCTTWW